MFTGIVEEVGAVAGVERSGATASVTVRCRTVVGDARAGDSVSVNGCCLTARDVRPDGFRADLMGPTLDTTALGDLVPGSRVNLERPVAAAGRLGGHLVQGHVDAVAEVLGVDPQHAWTLLTCSLPDELAPYVVERGSIAVDGVSLTVAGVGGGAFRVGLVPHTLRATTLGGRRVGDRVNLEADVVGKYVEALLGAGVASPYERGA
ncbi:MAG: riboflavin synthase [Actinobacteria bacterium]|nr:riboflavin synthase [Actinomycetota bacterium]